LDGRFLPADGGIRLSDVTRVLTCARRIFTNANNGLFDIQSDAGLLWTGSGAVPTFTNPAGSTLRKSAGNGDSVINFVFNNSGSVDRKSVVQGQRGDGRRARSRT